jgi:hypothetical protein
MVASPFSVGFYDPHGLAFTQGFIAANNHTGAWLQAASDLCVAVETAPDLDGVLVSHGRAVDIRQRPDSARAIGIL